MLMEKYIEIGNDRYHLSGVTVDDFIDSMLSEGNGAKVQDITMEDFENHPNRRESITFNVEDRFTATFYFKEYSSEEFRQEWLEAIGP